jgi:hypothetical protein
VAFPAAELPDLPPISDPVEVIGRFEEDAQ